MRGAALLFCLDATAKWVNRSVDPMVTVWARYMSAAFSRSSSSIRGPSPERCRTRRLPLQLLRSFLLFASTLCNFFALKYLQLVETQSIIFATPLIVALLAGPMLGERIGWQRMTAIGVGFIGILVITRPGLGTHASRRPAVAGGLRRLCLLRHRDADAGVERFHRDHDRSIRASPASSS